MNDNKNAPDNNWINKNINVKPVTYKNRQGKLCGRVGTLAYKMEDIP